MCGWTGHIQGNLALRVCEPLCGECAVQRQILSPGGYQGEGISVPRLRAEMGSPWSVSFFDTLNRPAAFGCGPAAKKEDGDDVAVLVHLEQPALQRHRQLVDERRVHRAGLAGVEAGLLHLGRLAVARDHPHIVGGDGVGRVGKADGEILPGQDVGRSVVVFAEAEHHLAGVVQAAPGRVHGVGGAVGVIGAHDQHRQRVEPGLCAKICPHRKSLLCLSKRLTSARPRRGPSAHSAAAVQGCWCSSVWPGPWRRSGPSRRRSAQSRTGRSCPGCGWGSWSRG